MSRSYHDRIAHALASLPPSLADVPQPVEPTPAAVLQNYSSFTTISLNPGWRPQPHQIIIEEPEQFIPLIAAYDSIRGTDYRDYAQAAVVHEAQHAEAARLLGARSLAFGVQFKRSRKHPRDGDTERAVCFNAFCISLDFVVTKLGLALIKAYPEAFLDADAETIKTMGYPGGIQEVGALAVAYNEWHTDQLPVPLTYAPGDPAMVSYYACG